VKTDSGWPWYLAVVLLMETEMSFENKHSKKEPNGVAESLRSEVLGERCKITVKSRFGQSQTWEFSGLLIDIESETGDLIR
jgi:hypothetical protein